jgi:hypothetical protein
MQLFADGVANWIAASERLSCSVVTNGDQSAAVVLLCGKSERSRRVRRRK